MSDHNHPGIYLIVEFDWPQPVAKEIGEKARHLHDVIQNQTWIRESVAGSGGLGDGSGSIWIFWLENYASLDRLLRDKSDEVSRHIVISFPQCQKSRIRSAKKLSFYDQQTVPWTVPGVYELQVSKTPAAISGKLRNKPGIRAVGQSLNL